MTNYSIIENIENQHHHGNDAKTIMTIVTSIEKDGCENDDYEDMWSECREEAKQLANELLAETPACSSIDVISSSKSVRDIFATAFMKPENLEAVITGFYVDINCHIESGRGEYCSDLVFRKGHGLYQTRVVTEYCREDNYKALREYISKLKALSEHPIVVKCREAGIDPEQVEVLECDSGVSDINPIIDYVLRTKDQIEIESKLFETRLDARIERLRGIDDAWAQMEISIYSSKLKCACYVVKKYILEYADYFGEIRVSEASDQLDENRRLFIEAVSFLLANNIIKVDGIRRSIHRPILWRSRPELLN